MNWMRFAAVVIGAGIATSLTDWLFAGDWIHRRFTYPEVWRTGAEGKAIALTSPLPFLTCAIFVVTALQFNHHSARNNFMLAAEIWLIGPLPLILTNAAFMKLHRVFVAFQALGVALEADYASRVASNWRCRAMLVPRIHHPNPWEHIKHLLTIITQREMDRRPGAAG